MGKLLQGAKHIGGQQNAWHRSEAPGPDAGFLLHVLTQPVQIGAHAAVGKARRKMQVQPLEQARADAQVPVQAGHHRLERAAVAFAQIVEQPACARIEVFGRW